jgi:hypothetical protein
MLTRFRSCGPDRVICRDDWLIVPRSENIKRVLLAMCFLLAILEVWYVARALEGIEYRFVSAHFG